MQSGGSILALTTLGNLGSASDVFSVQIPGCDSSKYQFEQCRLSKYPDLPCKLIIVVDNKLFTFH